MHNLPFGLTTVSLGWCGMRAMHCPRHLTGPAGESNEDTILSIGLSVVNGMLSHL